MECANAVRKSKQSRRDSGVYLLEIINFLGRFELAVELLKTGIILNPSVYSRPTLIGQVI